MSKLCDYVGKFPVITDPVSDDMMWKCRVRDERKAEIYAEE